MDGTAESIRLEHPGSLGEGSEFTLYRGGEREFHQVKRQHGNEGVWSLQTLEDYKVLTRFRDKLLGGEPGDLCVFASGHTAHPLDEISQRARDAQSAKEFADEFLRGRFVRDLKELRVLWGGLAEGDVWAALRRIRPENISETLLQRWNSERIGVLFEGHPDNATDVLAQFALDQVHQELNRDKLWNHLVSRTFTARDWNAASNAASIIERRTTDYLRRSRQLDIRGITIPRDEATIASTRLETGTRCLILAGERGSGKSGVAAQIIEMRREAGWHVLALRADEQHEFARPRDVGIQAGLDATPTTALAGVASAGKALLVIDQLDAVSNNGGRIPQFFDCVDEIREAALIHEQLHVVLVCRTADLEDDPRLVGLLERDAAARVDVGKLSRELVAAIVDSTCCHAAGLTEQQLELLRNPLHLRLLTEASTHPQIAEFRTYDDLCAMFTSVKRERHG